MAVGCFYLTPNCIPACPFLWLPPKEKDEKKPACHQAGVTAAENSLKIIVIC
jgi:hypothetical protein